MVDALFADVVVGLVSSFRNGVFSLLHSIPATSLPAFLDSNNETEYK